MLAAKQTATMSLGRILFSRNIQTSARLLFRDSAILNNKPMTEKQQQQPSEPEHIKIIVDQISQLKFYEVTLLNEALKRELKIPDVQRVVASGPVASQDGEDDAAASGVKSSFTVKLAKYDESKKVALIKEIKKLVEGINLVEAKRFVEECPKVIRANITKEEAESLQKQLEAAGGIVKVE